jgi:hypothetical protein
VLILTLLQQALIHIMVVSNDKYQLLIKSLVIKANTL